MFFSFIIPLLPLRDGMHSGTLIISPVAPSSSAMTQTPLFHHRVELIEHQVIATHRPTKLVYISVNW
jgi:hypothetical protein